MWIYARRPDWIHLRAAFVHLIQARWWTGLFVSSFEENLRFYADSGQRVYSITAPGTALQ